MARSDKLKAKILAKPPEIDFDELRVFLAGQGWDWRPSRAGGSHHFFSKPGVRETITVPTVGGRKVKRTCIVQVIKALGLED